MIHKFTALAVLSSMTMLQSSSWTSDVPETTYKITVTPLPARGDNGELMPSRSQRIYKKAVPVSPRTITIVYANDTYDRLNAKAFIEIIYRESRFNPEATNPSSGAYGLGQALPPEKMDSVAPDWKTNIMTQLTWVSKYITERYDTPIEALEHHDKKGWY